MNGFNLNGVRMNVVTTAASGVVNAETIFTFAQKQHVVTADYQGGGVTEGRLIGKIDGAAMIFRYCQISHSGDLDGGVSQCVLDRLPDGRIRMVERFQWDSRDTVGENVFEQLK